MLSRLVETDEGEIPKATEKTCGHDTDFEMQENSFFIILQIQVHCVFREYSIKRRNFKRDI